MSNSIDFEKDYIIKKGTVNDIDELENLYNDLNDYLENGINYAGWIKGIYPTREEAVNGIEEDNLFVLKINDVIAGTIILNHHEVDAYKEVKWGIEPKEDEIVVIHTFAIHPKYKGKGVGAKLIDFSKGYCKGIGMKTIRLDVSIHNKPAISLYEKSGYKCVGTVDLGLNIPDLKWFKLYELIL